MKTIRYNTFETNSSSSHSLTYDGKGTFQEWDGVTRQLVLGYGQYDWESMDYTEPLTKADYLAVYSFYEKSDWGRPIDGKQIQTWIKEILNESYGIPLDEISFTSQPGMKRYESFIDHQSLYQDELVGSKEHMRNFITRSDGRIYQWQDIDDY